MFVTVQTILQNTNVQVVGLSCRDCTALNRHNYSCGNCRVLWGASIVNCRMRCFVVQLLVGLTTQTLLAFHLEPGSYLTSHIQHPGPTQR